MSWDYTENDMRQTKLFDDMAFVHSILIDIVDWSREATHSLYKEEAEEGREWDGPSEDYLGSKAWEIVAILKSVG